MNWLLYLVIFAGVATLIRLFFIVRKARATRREDDWDAKLISTLRARGMDPFGLHNVDFFFALPDDAAIAGVNAELEKQGFRMDVKAVPDSADYAFSLHASKNMRVHVDEMRECSRRFTELARAHRGRYDGWSSD